MNNGNLLTIGSLFYSLLLIIAFYSKKRIKSIENSVYSLLIISNFLGLIIAIVCYFTVLNYETMVALNYIISRLYLVYLLFFILVFFFYLIATIYGENGELNPKIRRFLYFLLIVFTVVCALIFSLPLYYHNTDGAVYSYGPAANLMYVVATVCMVSWTAILLKNYKKIKNKKFLPIIIFIIGAMIITVIQKLNPALLLMTSMETFVTVVMYFTIENPDLKMLRNYHEAKEYAEDLNTEKQMFIYNLSQDMKRPLLKTAKYCENLQYSDDIEEYKNGIRNIKSECNSMIQKINSIFDIEVSDIRDLGTDNTKYNLSNLLKVSLNNMKQNVDKSNKKIEFISSISDTLPKELIGDSTRIKEVLKIIFDNALKYTKEGFIEFKVQGLNKGNICRLLISLEDSGEGMDAETLQNLFDREKIVDKTSNSSDKIDPNKENLALAKRIVNLLGGNLIVTSSLGVGTKISIVLDQEIVPAKAKQDIDKYEKKYFEQNLVLVLGATDEERKVLMRSIANLGGVMETVDSVNEVIEKIKNHKKYNAIIVDGELPYYNIAQVAEKLKNIKGLNSDIIVLSKNKEMKSAKNRAMVGVQAYLARPLNDEIVEETLNKLLKN